MKIIRDEECGELFMIPLFVDWKVRRCNQEECKAKPTTIITGTEAGVFGLCEEHYQQGNQPGGTKYNLIFDNYDAFKEVADGNSTT